MTFARPLTLAGVEKPLPAGTYDVVTEEEQLDGVSFSAFRQLQTYVTRCTTHDGSGKRQTMVVDLDELVRAHEEEQKLANQDY